MASESRDLERMLGDPRSAIRSMLLPLVVSYLVVQINLFADTSWCSGLGADASSAVSTISPIYWIVSGLGTGLGIGAATSIARYLGRGEKHNADRLVTQTIILSVVIGIATTPIVFLAVDPALAMMGAEDIAEECRSYIYPQVLAGTVVILDGTVSGVIRAEGAAKRSMVVLLTSAAVNMVLDPVLIYGLDMGLAGAGWATAIASASSAALGLWWYARGKLYLTIRRSDARPNLRDMKDILYVGIPRGTESMLISVMSMVQRIFVIACGGTSAAMFYNIPWRFVSISEVVSQAVGSALIPVCSAALGRRDFRKAEVGYRYSLTLTMVVMIAIAAVLFVFADWLIIPFTYSGTMAEFRPEFAHVLRIYALLIPFMGMIDIGSSILQSLRMAQLSMLSSFARNILIVVMLFFASSVSLDAIYWSLVVAEVFGGILMLWLAKAGLRHYKHGREKPEAARSREYSNQWRARFAGMEYEPGIDIAEDPEVYPPSDDSILLIESLDVREGERVLEVGCGSGVVSIHCARNGCHVTAVDINPRAVGLAKRNAAANGVDIQVSESDVYENVDGRFDTIVFNLPYLPVDEEGLLAKAWSGGPDGLGPLPRLLEGAPDRLVPNGRVVVVMSSLTEPRALEDALEGYEVRTLEESKLFFERLSVLEIRGFGSK